MTIRVKLCTSILIFLFVLPPPIEAQDRSLPCPRNQPVVTYHKSENAMFLFGGYCSLEKKQINALWKFDGENWFLIQTDTSPSPRSGHAMVYDERNDQLVVFGGRNSEAGILNDTWVWNGEHWLQLLSEAPPQRQSHRMIYNNKDGRIYLFGGSDVNGQSLNDTWVLEKNTWTKLASGESPPARLQHTMAYDESKNKIILFGGFDRIENDKIVFGDTWELDEKGWLKKDENPQLARDHHAMAYDFKAKRVVLFGGYNQTYFGDTRSWDGNSWILIADSGPSPRAGKPGLFYNYSNENIVLFGGWGNNNAPLTDFWSFEFNAKKWSSITN